MPVPDTEDDLRSLVRLALAAAVHSDKRQEYVERIQALDAPTQAHIMAAIEAVIDSAKSNDEPTRLRAELERANERLATQKTASALRLEIDALTSDLARVEALLGEAQSERDAQAQTIATLERQAAEWAPVVHDYDRLKDEHDEWKHQIEKARKSENVIEKYRRKLEDMNKLRATVQKLEDENERLVETNVAIEDELAKLRSSRPSADQQSATVDRLEREIATVTEKNADLERSLALAVHPDDHAVPTDDDRKAFDADVEDGAGEQLEVSLAENESSLTRLRKRIIELERQLNPGSSQGGPSSSEDRERIERDWLAERKERVALEGRLEKIMSSASPATSALRERIKKLEHELETVSADARSARQQLDHARQELDRARSDLRLVDQDQLDALDSLRSSVEVSSVALRARLGLLEGELDEQRATARDRDRLLDSLSARLATADSAPASLDRASIGLTDDLQRVSPLLSSLIALRHARGCAWPTNPPRSSITFRESAKSPNLVCADACFSGQRIVELEAKEGEAESLAKELARVKAVSADREGVLERELKLLGSAWHEVQLKCQRQALALAALVPDQKIRDGRADGAQGEASPSPHSWLSQQRLRSSPVSSR